MNEAEALEIVQFAFQILLKVSAPIVITAMLVGTLIALFQALTQIQEVTLTFIPKIVAVMVVASLAAPFMASQLNLLAILSFSKISEGF
ncbi:MAG: flagellar biosynthetic protein FliQ [Rhizobiaceae bacterium]|jgi:flagellar biosynthetic protein FliQ|nr:flagellar biosynthetic protein FliQ [Rhizobiaceae bacterium]